MQVATKIKRKALGVAMDVIERAGRYVLSQRIEPDTSPVTLPVMSKTVFGVLAENASLSMTVNDLSNNLLVLSETGSGATSCVQRPIYKNWCEAVGGGALVLPGNGSR